MEIKEIDFRCNMLRFYDFDVLKGLFNYIVREGSGEAWIAGVAARYILSKNTWCSLPFDIDVWMEFDIGDDSIIELFLKKIFPSKIASKIKIFRTEFKLNSSLSQSIVNIICQPWAPNIQIMCGCQFPMEDILKQFDFSVCKAAIQAKRYKINKESELIDTKIYNILYDKNFFDDEKNNRLRLPSNIGKDKLWRIYKYYCKGYHLQFEDAVKMIEILQTVEDSENSKITHVMLKNFRENPDDFFIAPILRKLYKNFLDTIKF